MKNEKNILNLLINENYISEENADEAWSAAQKDDSSAVAYLMDRELLSKEVLGMAIAESYGLGFADFGSHEPSEAAIAQLPKDVANKYRVVVYQEKKDKVVLASDQPKNADMLVALKEVYPAKKFEVWYSLGDEIDGELVNYRDPLSVRLRKIVNSGVRVAPGIIDAIVVDAIVTHASDIHFEPEEKTVMLRMRVDGVLQDVGELQLSHYRSVLNRIKVMANLRIDEHDAVQDGAARYVSKQYGAVDMRISIAPTVDGEKVVIRVLTAHGADFTLADLGLGEADQKIIEAAGKKPFGMIVVTGPTGSGKTTTLYALMKFIKDRTINITTIEDPVEYKIPGIAQIQVNPATNLTFGAGLKSIVRQDPDVILVGEVRDFETAEIAINAALTGHLMLTTFHANDAATAIPRLLDLGIEPFLLSSTLEVVVAQRLVRKLCQSCRVGSPPKVAQIAKEAGISTSAEKNLEKIIKSMDKSVNFYEGKGCNVCHNTGYRGRVGIFEIISMNDELKELILNRPSRNEIWEKAEAAKALSLFEDGIEKVKAGQTSLAELIRVVPIPAAKDSEIKK